ncbi:unnamed protein product, partial [Musa textilis]
MPAHGRCPTPPSPSGSAWPWFVGIFVVMFSVAFLLLVYVKFCRFAAAELSGNGGFLLPQNRFSGIDKAAVESLPLFRFSELRGARDGLECAVCQCRFDVAELRRLLPRCKHAFHVDCVDRWLAAHSTCPLCRCKVNAGDDTAVFEYSIGSRFLFASAGHEDGVPDLELFVEREAVDDGDRDGRSFRKINTPEESTNRAR